MNYLTDADLAERIGATEAQVIRWRSRYNWPHLKVGRKVRYTEADVREIEARHHVKGERPVGLPGQTSRSARRSA